MNHKTGNMDPEVLHFILKQNGNFPNSSLPVLIYKKALTLPQEKEKAAGVAEKIFLANDWGNSWQNGIYDFHHYHSVTHECLAIVTGNVEVILGGPGGKKAAMDAGDVIIIPAGVAHKCLFSSPGFLCVGCYPEGHQYDMNYGKPSELKDALIHILQVPLPANDPVFGNDGILKSFWRI